MFIAKQNQNIKSRLSDVVYRVGNRTLRIKSTHVDKGLIFFIIRAGRHRVEVSAPFILVVFFPVALVQRMRYANAEPTFLKA